MILKKRIDLEMVSRGLAKSRNLAQRLVLDGKVRVNGKVITKVSFDVGPDQKIEVDSTAPILKYVSRGGLKLESALRHVDLDVTSKLCLDIGISTGGFSDCLLQHGARGVVGIDVGHGQLSEKLKHDARLTLIEGINARDLSKDLFQQKNLPTMFDLVVVDISFISLTYLPMTLKEFMSPGGHLLALVKPQFELSGGELNKSGVVKESENYLKVEQKIKELCHRMEIEVLDYFQSVLEGADGNTEFFVFGRG